MGRRSPVSRITWSWLVVAVGVTALQAGANAGTAGEWPCFHGPRRDNKSTETGLLKPWPDEGPTLLWTASGLGKGFSTVSLAGGLLYTAGMVEKQTYVVALDLDGKEVWRTLNGRSWATTMRHAISYDGARSTPTYDEGRLYHLGECGRLACLEPKSGNELWNLDLLKEFDATTPRYGLAESVLIDGDRLICCPGGTKGYMVCLDKRTGKRIWANAEVEGTQGYASPVIAELGGFRQLLCLSAKVVFSVDASTGRLLWSVELENERGNNATDAVFHNGHVYATSPYGRGSILLRLTAAQGGVTATEAWASKLLDNHHGGVVLLDGHLYGAGHRSRGWFCLDFLTGTQVWREPRGKGSLTYADGMLYCLDERGTLALVEATAKEYRAVSSFRVPKGGRGPYWAHPVVCGGRLYVRHADQLFAYDIRAE